MSKQTQTQTQTQTAQRDALILEIAKGQFFIETLETRERRQTVGGWPWI